LDIDTVRWFAAQNSYKGGIRPQLRALAKTLRDNQGSLDDLTTDLDALAEMLVAAALAGDARAIQEIARVFDE
jgi:hypothetical protein